MSDKEKTIVGEVKNRFSLSRSLPGFINKPVAVFRNKYKNLPKKIRIIFLLVLVLLVLSAGAYGVFIVVDKVRVKLDHNYAISKAAKELTVANRYAKDKNKAQALAHARAALALAPNDPDTVLEVAALTQQDNPTEAKQVYAQALALLKTQDNPDVSGKKAITYWAAAQLAERAGLIDQARQYYQKVIDTANQSNSYEKSLLQQSQAALKRLQ